MWAFTERLPTESHPSPSSLILTDLKSPFHPFLGLFFCNKETKTQQGKLKHKSTLFFHSHTLGFHWTHDTNTNQLH